MTIEFVCSECTRSVMALAEVEPPPFNLCAACVTVPGWYRCARMRVFLCADHDGLEPWEREAPDGGL